VSFDTTKEPFYGEISKIEGNEVLFLHSSEKKDPTEFHYEYLTASITCNVTEKYILDGIVVPRGYYVEDYVREIITFIKELIPVELFLFDRGFTSWGIIYFLKNVQVNYMIFWKKQGDWYKGHFEELKEGESKFFLREKKYNRHKTNYKVSSGFVLIKQLKYEEKQFDWIFATNIKRKKAEDYVKRYKKRWGIETVYRVTDKIRAYTTSTKSIIRYFLFMFTCMVYNLWKFFQSFIGEDFTLSNFKINMIIFMAKTGKIYPTHFDKFFLIANKIF